MHVIPTSIASFLVTCTMLLALRLFAQVVGLIDRPGGRKTHHGDVPVVGGVSMFFGLLVAAAATPVVTNGVFYLLVVSAFMVIVGALDDRFDLPPKVRLFAHLTAAVVLLYGTGYKVSTLGNLLGFADIPLDIMAVPFTVLAVMALINGFNMLDGLDGLAGGVGLVALASITMVASMAGVLGPLTIAGGMLGAVAAFLLFNMPAQFNRSVRTFMGDAGSTLLGFLLAGLFLILVQPETAGIPPVAVLWFVAIPIFELFSSTARRIMRGVSPAQADTGHFHHLLVASGLSVRAVCLLYFLVSLACCSFGVWGYKTGISEPIMFWMFCAVFACWLLLVRKAPLLVRRMPVWFRRTDMSLEH